MPVFALTALAALPVLAQQPSPPYVDALPGAGRAIDVAATTARRQRLADRLGDAVVVIPAAHERNLELDYSQDSDFRQHNTFYYLTMLESPDAWLVINARANGPDSTVLLLASRTPRQIRFEGPKIGPGEEAVRLTGIPTVIGTAKLDSVLGAAFARRVPVYVPLDHSTQYEPRIQRLRADSASLALRNLRPVADSMRLVKDSTELAYLRRAIELTALAHAELMRQARAGMFEYELEAILEAAFRRQGADRLGYPSIVGSGPNGTILHYSANRRQTRPGEVVVVDAGAEYGYYTADVTRTFPISGTFTPRQRAVYDLVLATQQAAMDSVRPGITVGRLGQISRDYMRDHSGDLCAPQTCDAYYIHGLSHWLGMDVHDVGDYGTPLAPGMVLTIEPGIYIPAESLGVRIEDDVLVTPAGYELLSGAAPRRPVEVERVMREGRESRGRAEARPGTRR
ncbi:MAG: aminopeptidase P family protein [Gemmatimonadetes bacterium]|nr:aminopeptidase P family protein [Gemmatimonadota bacterium]